MKIFDFTVNTQDATIDDFNNAVDYLRYMDARSNWNTDGYSVSDRPNFFNKQPLTYEEYENWIKAIYVFVERCIDFYPPSSNFSFPYRKFNMQDGIEHYLFIYIMMEYMKNKEYSLFEYNYYDDEITFMEKELSTFVNTSKFIRAFIIAYKPVVDFNMDRYKNFGESFKMNDFRLDCFPFIKTSFEYCVGTDECGEEIYEEISFAIPQNVICEEKLYEIKPIDCYYNKEKIQKYFELHIEYKEKFDAIIGEIKNNQIKKDELERKRSKLWDERAKLLQEKASCENELEKISYSINANYQKLFYNLFKYKKDIESQDFYINKKINIEKNLSSVQNTFESVEKQIYELSGKNKMRTFILSLPDFIPYQEV